MKLIKLTQGQCAKVDDCDYNFLMRFKWFAYKKYSHKGITFAASTDIVTKTKTFRFDMHRIVMGLPVGVVVYHINGDALDNRRVNLGECTQAERAQNKGKRFDNKSGIKGVYRWGNSWSVNIKVRGKTVYGGTFKCPLLAANKYRELARKYHGKFANFG